MKEKIINHIKKFNELKLLVIGDVMLDHYILGDVSRISPEAPVPVVDIQKESLLLGGAANVANNIISLGANAMLTGVIGKDDTGAQFSEILKKHGISDYILRSDKRPTTIKTRIIARQQQLVRFDRELKKKLYEEEKTTLIDILNNLKNNISGIVVSDYAKGVICTEIMTLLLNFSKRLKIPVFIDPKPKNIEYYKGATVITPNQHEAEMISGITINDTASLFQASMKIKESFDVEAVLITRGPEGMSLFKDNKIYTIPTMAKEVFDVTGAGDTSIASFALGYVSGLDFLSSVILSNIAAGIVVSKLGTGIVTFNELTKALNEMDFSNFMVEGKGLHE